MIANTTITSEILEDIAKSVATPFYVYDQRKIEENAAVFEVATREKPSKLLYAMKANDNPAIVRLLHERGWGSVVASQGALERSLEVGIRAENMLALGPGKGDRFLELCAEHTLLVSLESRDEMVALAGFGQSNDVLFRVNPNVPADTHPHLSTGEHRHHFGIDEDELSDYWVQAKEQGLRPVGLHVHVGSQLLSSEPFKESAEYIARLLQAYPQTSVVDVGGGIGIAYDESQKELPVGDVIKMIRDVIGDKQTIIFEPGRSIVGSAGVLVARVLAHKTIQDKTFVVLDAGMGDILRPALYGARHRIVPLRRREGEEESVTIAGPFCESADVFGDYQMPLLKRGDLVTICDVGAYGRVMASHYMTRSLAPEIMVAGTDWCEI